MRRLVTMTAALLTGALALACPAARAAADSRYKGGCGFDTLNAPPGTDQWTGAVHAAVVLYSTTGDNVVQATVTCELRVNGVVTQTFSGSGAGVVAFASPVTVTAQATDVVWLCDVVDFTSDDTPTRRDCGEGDPQLIPQYWFDLTVWAVATVNWSWATVLDPVTCERLAALAPGAGPVTIDPDGDVYVGGHDPYTDMYYDCPPYSGYEPYDPGPVPTPPGLPSGPPDGSAGYDDGARGFRTVVTADVSAACAFHTGPDGTIAVSGAATAAAGTTALRCRLLDTASGSTLYDRTVAAAGPAVTLLDTVAPAAGPVTVCTEGSTTTATTGLACRHP